MDIRYPIGQFEHSEMITRKDINGWVDELEAAPTLIRAAIDGLSEEQLDTPYRESGWNPRQIVHHMADSNLNMYTRFKLALTEENPLVVVYNETLWSELYDAKTAPVEDSLILLDGLHRRWVRLLRSMSDEDYKKSFVHPNAGAMPLDRGVGAYSWHTRHHTAQIIELRKRRDW